MYPPDFQKSRDALEESEARAADALRVGEREKVRLKPEILIPETLTPRFGYQWYRATSLIRNSVTLGPYSRAMLRAMLRAVLWS